MDSLTHVLYHFRMSSPAAGPSTLGRLTGTIPGVIDPSQRDRLLTFTHSSLSFASFNPHTATSSNLMPDARKLSLNQDLSNPRRIVIERLPTGASLWRFVPKARRDQNVFNEGEWPRVINICGTLYGCSEDQWDIYKLDPMYECQVRLPPALTTITPALQKPPESPHSAGKRTLTRAGIPTLNPRKKINTRASFDSDDDDDEIEEVEDMIIDQTIPSRAKSVGLLGTRLKKMREGILQSRQQRRESTSRRAEKLSKREEAIYYDFRAVPPSERSQSVPSENATKRKATILTDPLRSPEGELGDDLFRNTFMYEQNAQGKRTRKTSPGAARRELDAKRARRDRRREDRRRSKVSSRRQQWHEQFMQEVYAEVPELKPAPSDIPAWDNHNQDLNHNADGDVSDNEDSEGGPSTDSSFDEDAARAAAIAESRRKLAELEADRPLWEASAKQRALREKAEQETFRLKAEQRRWDEAKRTGAARRAEDHHKAREAKEREEAARREQEEVVRQEREDAGRRKQERERRNQRWTYGPWSPGRALEKYKVMSDDFDSTKFSAHDPLSFDVVPWPVLAAPSKLSVEDVDWTAVETFFHTIRRSMLSQDFKILVEKSHKRFHPDRWRSRGLLKTVVDEAERGCLEVAATTVAQALTPIWRDLTGR
ncbi:hypothetical protein D9757_000584 [Collybiopsis confluens]|uniref:Uncharacterized protein n=1 Tax=Collybiopsis confluens TaxID=2823264 RepID=A0A8H5I1J6_9AGAR|nr:hypothetical protein D9757_000584 [Collybiopsis confluens]